MKEINEMTIEEYQLIKEIILLKKLTQKQLQQLHRLVQTFIDDKAKVCGACPSQIKFLHKRLCNWYNKNIVEIENTFK